MGDADGAIGSVDGLSAVSTAAVDVDFEIFGFNFEFSFGDFW